VRLIVVRHGETPFNARGLFTGQLDIPLSAQGERQTEAVGQRLSERRPDVIVSSDLQRARVRRRGCRAGSGEARPRRVGRACSSER
jgi:broad specificity phosphatase PhoE